MMRKLAETYHAGQVRKGDVPLPYIVHPQAVAETLLAWGEPSSSPAVAVAWGHDLLEDTVVTDAEIVAAGGEYVLECIKMLTHSQDEDKARYLQGVADCGNRDVLLVKIADRICNSRDFVELSGVERAFSYLHYADCLVPALERISGDAVVQRALQAWHEWDAALREKV